MREGRVDIVIGTHRLLQGDVNFRNLGLIVVDEEQRFGVKHKERLKRLRTDVDVLTMTATPIPPAPHFALYTRIPLPPSPRTLSIWMSREGMRTGFSWGEICKQSSKKRAWS